MELWLEGLEIRWEETRLRGWLSKSYGKTADFLSINAQIITGAYKGQI